MKKFRQSAILDTEHLSVTDKMFGILCVDDNEFADAMISEVVGGLMAAGCIEQNIKIKHIPLDDDIPLGVLFFAEYTDVDAVIVLSQVVPYDYIKQSVIDIQLQWNMPTLFGSTNAADANEPYLTVARRAITMVSLQEQMQEESDEIMNPDRKSIN